MGFLDFISNIGSKIKNGISTIGNFVADKVRPVIGTISGVARKIGDVIHSDTAQSILNGLSSIPGPLGMIARGVNIAGNVASTVGNVGDNIGKGIDIASGVAKNITGSNPNLGQAFQDVKKGYGLVNDSRNLINQARPSIYNPNKSNQ